MSKLEQMHQTCSDILARHRFMGEQELAGKYAELSELVLDREIFELPYEVRNAPFLTASKMIAFKRCPFCYKKKYIEQIPDRTLSEKDYFVIGQAVDDILTLGWTYFETHYVVMDSRISDIQEAVAGLEGKISDAQSDVKKDGSRSATGLKAEAKARERIAFLQSLGSKTQITQSMADQIVRIISEYNQNGMFNMKPAKKVFFHVFAGFLIKVELDDFDQEKMLIADTKTTNSILNCDHNFAEKYKTQMTMYQWAVEENLFQRPRVQLRIVDKGDNFSRSHCIEYLDATLMEHRGELVSLIEKMREAHDLDFFTWAMDQNTLFNCPYYGIENHGRPTQPIYY